MSFMHDGEYVCICGRIFKNSQSFNGHKSHCEIYLKSVDKFESRQAAKKIGSDRAHATQHKQAVERKVTELQNWLKSNPICETCGKVMTEYYGTGRFCSRSCANKRKLTEDVKFKISNGLNNYYSTGSYSSKHYKSKDNNLSRDILRTRISDYDNNPTKCKVCGTVLSYKQRYRKTCSEYCLHRLYVDIGIKVAAQSSRRSQNEIAFCNKCEDYFGKDNVLHNEPMFNGWDADIILPQYKLAILWNGPWHYRKVTKSHSLKQVQTRDKIKADQIAACGYTLYIIKDLSKKNVGKVEKEFNLLLNYLKCS